MITPEDFLARWQSNKYIPEEPEWASRELVRYAPAIVERLNIPLSSKRFLTEAGLPLQPIRHVRFDLFDLWNNRFPAIPDIFPTDQPPPEYRRYRVIRVTEIAGPDSRLWPITYYCVDEQENGRVINFSYDEGWKVDLVNSSVEQFAEYCLLFRESRAWGQQHFQKHLRRYENKEIDSAEWLWYESADYREECTAYRRELLHHLERIDPDAMNSCGGWSGIITDIYISIEEAEDLRSR